ncbi:hypothetical protein BJ742DRAFT_741681 [Cladochytrium replicatum]|nr:hypothetical protein BJ742DRAFT_741681 [Cladochytrium replicatum]
MKWGIVSRGGQFGKVLVNRIVKDGHSTGKWQRDCNRQHAIGRFYGNQEAEAGGWEERTTMSWWKGVRRLSESVKGIVGMVKWKPKGRLLVAGTLRVSHDGTPVEGGLFKTNRGWVWNLSGPTGRTANEESDWRVSKFNGFRDLTNI